GDWCERPGVEQDELLLDADPRTRHHSPLAVKTGAPQSHRNLRRTRRCRALDRGSSRIGDAADHLSKASLMSSPTFFASAFTRSILPPASRFSLSVASPVCSLALPAAFSMLCFASSMAPMGRSLREVGGHPPRLGDASMTPALRHAQGVDTTPFSAYRPRPSALGGRGAGVAVRGGMRRGGPERNGASLCGRSCSVLLISLRYPHDPWHRGPWTSDRLLEREVHVRGKSIVVR